MASDEAGSTSGGDDGFPDATRVIEALGGIRPAAGKLGVPVTTVQGWKNRGRIPENRYESIREVAARLGVDLEASDHDRKPWGAAMPQPHPEPQAPVTHSNVAEVERPASETAETSEEPKASEPEAGGQDSPDSSVTAANTSAPDGSVPNPMIPWISLVVALLAVVGVAVLMFRPDLLSRIGIAAGGDGTGSMASIESRLGSMEQRIDELANAKPVDTGSGQEIVETVNSLAKRVDTTLPRMDEMRNAIDALTARLAEIEGRLKSVGEQAGATFRSEAQAITEKVAALEKEQSAIQEKVAALRAAESQGAGGLVPTLLSVGQLEASVRAGDPYRGAMERLRRVAADRPALADTLERLEPWADKGVPTVAELERQLEDLRPVLAAGPVPPEGRGFLESVWARVRSTLAFRRIDAASRSPITQAERALQSGDLAAAIAAVEGFGEEVEQWRTAVRARQESEAALRELHDRVFADTPPATEGTSVPVGEAGTR